MAFAEGLRGVNSKLFNEARREMAHLFGDWPECPPSIRAEYDALVAWENERTPPRRARPGRYAAIVTSLRRILGSDDYARQLWEAWKTEQLAAGRDLHQGIDVVVGWAARRGLGEREARIIWLEHWRKKERHLFDWEQSLQLRLRRRRQELYGAMARQAAAENSRCLIDKTDLARVAKKPETEEEYEQWDAARRQRQLASVSSLRAAMRTYFGAFSESCAAPSEKHAHCGGRLRGGGQRREREHEGEQDGSGHGGYSIAIRSASPEASQT